MVAITHLFISPGHNFFGHHGGAPGAHPMLEVEAVEAVAGRGLRGDRFFDYKENYKGQATFFALETHAAVARALGVEGRPPSVYRRNILTRGLDLPALVGRRFRLGGLEFEGTDGCSPCGWMDTALAPGAERLLQGRGGLRARIVAGGVLRRAEGLRLEVLAAGK